MTTILNGVLSEESVTMNDTRISAKEAVARKLLAIAMAGDISALKYIYDRMDGAPNRSGNITVTGGMAVNDMTPEGMARFKENFTALFPEAASTAIDDIPCMEEEEAED